MCTVYTIAQADNQFYYNAGNDLLASKISTLTLDIREDLQQQLEKELKHIIKHYGNYVTCVHKSLEAKGVSAKDLCLYLLTISAFNHKEKKLMLLSSHRDDLENAADICDIIRLLTVEYASFLNYDIFQLIENKFTLNEGQEDLKYPEHLADYINRHKVSEFMEINPFLYKFTKTSKKLVLKFDIESTSRLSKLVNFKKAIADILDLKSSALQLLSVTDGCVVATFLLPAFIAEATFTGENPLTQHQMQAFRALPVLWLESNKCKIMFSETTTIRYYYTYYSELPLIRTPEMWPPLYSGHFDWFQGWPD